MLVKKIVPLTIAGLVALSHGAVAQEIADNGQGEISVGASYSSHYGAIVVLGFDGTNIGGTGIDAAIDFRRGEKGEGGTGRLRYNRDLQTERLGQNAQLFIGASFSLSDWDFEAYKNKSQELTFGIKADIGPALGYTAALFANSDELSQLGANASPLITAAQGTSTAAGAEIVAHIGKLQGGVLPTSGAQLDLGVTWAGGGDRKTSSLFAASAFAVPVSAKNFAVFRAETGRIQGLDGQSVGIQDRAFLGGSGGPRGFAFGSIGPRDVVPGSIDSPLGGNRYFTVSAEVRRDINDRLAIGTFADAGAVWDLGAAPLTGASGVIDDARHLRSSAGVAIYVDTGLGKLNLSIAKPIESKSYDTFNEVSLSLVRSF